MPNWLNWNSSLRLIVATPSLTVAERSRVPAGMRDRRPLPLSAVVESLQPKPGDIKTMANKGRVIQVRGDYLPLLVLHEVFGLESATTDFTQGVMVILDADGCKAALFVDELVGQHQVVIKSLEANYRRVPGISGATIMGDGHVAMILDASAITGMTRTNQQQTK